MAKPGENLASFFYFKYKNFSDSRICLELVILLQNFLLQQGVMLYFLKQWILVSRYEGVLKTA
ncbi:MAG: hypothetical protein COY58_04065 [Gammaproteobacteria bacterium CG_4_10_14_0_8_um_filter_38_16]|nr:MAG: hypothetical protein COY58_04065 [Gammaproteobacteria bacterium CG_4_10_14_0_8_um_filter_38_16]PJA02722.1 MAG: hypothetical protein COX72_08900 [Gammaproteobacteria bacterium CG_4_10_14_0_2_um_filter_38_22]PJB09800.1 MAG: hypothetical protein CO120_08190 [Gammaproteobacteria bacterium CG_4_9_14_3_um_filter_38_9]